ncbi:hypothetical protein N7495_001941 [Penicillium taxi]|uniref:uncharacterized protein n=1 Tax=Penicillium taxi TaxID=168475 RepID=UPI0025455317|nr:uncharacterized protein N7495_001941 [Penicillium taxi]KAJ5909259.1 hypothetical protein N7495_001941 [Penicillium taxi]
MEPEGVWEDSPEALAYYRNIYDENLAIAANDPRCRNDILRRILLEIWIAAGKDEQSEFIDIAEMFAQN